jgi:Rnl2 family RNA ligase
MKVNREEEMTKEIVFQRYHSIVNAGSKSHQDLVEHECIRPDQVFVVHEKIHGANFSVITDGVSELCASRNEILVDHKFYNYKRAYGPLEGKFKECFPLIEEIVNNKVLRVHFFSELAGGYYPGTKKIEGVRKVQGNVSYHADQKLFFYDIMVLLDNGGTQQIYLGDQEFQLVMNTIPTAVCIPVLFKGTIEECLEFSGKHINDTTGIPGIFGLPEIEGNLREGHIIKDSEAHIGYPDTRAHRPILKDKSDKFAEKDKPKLKSKVVIEDKLFPWISEGELLVNQNRLDNVISHLTEDDMSNFGVVAKEFSQDIIEEFSQDNKEFNALEDAHKKIVVRTLTKSADNLVREYFKKEIW